MSWSGSPKLRECTIVIRLPGCPMYPLILKEKNVQPAQFSAYLLERLPYHGRGCAAGMPNGYVTVLPNGDVIPCTLLQVKVGNIREASITRIWEDSPILARLGSRVLEDICSDCRYRGTCAGWWGRA